MNQIPVTTSKCIGGTSCVRIDRELDQKLVARVKDGDQRAFRQLFDRYHRRAFAVAYGVVKREQDALDVVQEAFIKVYRHIDNFQGNSSFYTWLYRIVTNLAIDHVRKRRRGSEQECEETRLLPDGEVQLPQFLDSNPVRTVLRKELLEAIHSALAELPEYHRAVILLREVEGLSYDEIATILEVPKGTIMSRLFHARRRMQQVLAEYLQGDLSIEEAP